MVTGAMNRIVIEYEDGTIAIWTCDDDKIQDVEDVVIMTIGQPDTLHI